MPVIVKLVPPMASFLPTLSLCAVASEAAFIVPYWLLTSWLMLILVPAAICPLLTFLISCRNPNEVPPPDPLTGGCVTVMSVPTPYSVCSTVACEALTPSEAAVTVITRPTPSARPSAMRTAWRSRRRSSRQRYVKNMGRLLIIASHAGFRPGSCRQPAEPDPATTRDVPSRGGPGRPGSRGPRAGPGPWG